MDMRSTKPPKRPLVEAMEPRILHSADVAPLLVGASVYEIQPVHINAPAVAQTVHAEIAFIDSALSDADELRVDLLAQQAAGRPIEIVTIALGQDGIALITQTLADRHDVSAVHVLAHGSDGQMQLGSSQLDAQSLMANAGEIAGWSSALAPDADLLLYGCDLAQTGVGLQLVHDLAALTGADVAASTDLTGAAARGGDWVLEVHTGSIETALAPSLAEQAQWQGVMAATYYYVDHTSDDNANSSSDTGSLRWAITQANANDSSEGSVIQLMSPGIYSLTRNGGVEDDNATGDLDIKKKVTIVGATAIAADTVISGATDLGDRVFDMRIGSNVTLQNLTIQGGRPPGIYAVASGGGIMVNIGASATLTNVVVTNNSASWGGGVANYGTLSAYQTQFNNNAVTGQWGGGIYNENILSLTDSSISNNSGVLGAGLSSSGWLGTFPNVTLTRVTVSNNTASGSGSQGGGIYVEINSSLSISNSSITGNGAGLGAGLYIQRYSTGVTVSSTVIANNSASSSGGAIYSDVTGLTITNSTISGNSAQQGGGLWTKQNGNTISSSTIAGNTASSGGGGIYSNAKVVIIESSILANNTGGNSNRAQISGGFNADTDGTASLNLATDLHPTLDALNLGALADNGGFGETIALGAGSVAINAGNPLAPGTDQRGVSRTGAPDIGAYEFSSLVSSVTDSNAAANTLAENATVGAVVGLTALATDSGATITYSLSSNPDNLFAINSGTGVVILAGALNYESATSHNITVLATSSNGSTGSAVFNIAVTNVNDNAVSSLTDSNATANTLAENASAGALTSLTALATDADAGATISYSLSSNPGNLFAINSSTGAVTLAGVLDYESATSHNVTVLATSSDGSANSAVFSIAVTNVNDNAVSSLTDSNATANTLAENASAGALTGLTALATDADAGATISYSLSSNPGNLFAINSSTGVVTLAGVLNYESATSHNVTVLATSSDGSANSAVFSIAVTNVNDNAVSVVTDSNAGTNTVAESASAGATVGLTASATDADSGASISYSLSSNPGNLFAIDAVTGAVTLAGVLDYESATSHNFTILATSSDGSANSAVFSIAVTNVNDNAVSSLTDSNATANTLAENASAGALTSLTALATDADAGATISYSLSSNPGNLFAINSSTGVVTLAGVLNYESATSHNVTVLATSSDGSANSAVFSIAVTNVNDNAVSVVTDSNSSTNTVAENASAAAIVGLTASATDADSGATISYSLSSNPGNIFAIDAATGVVTLAGVLDYESAASHNITILATSSDGSTSGAAFIIAVTNVNDNAVGGVADNDASANAVAENASVGTVAGVTALAADADAGASITYSLSSNPGNLFAIDVSTGVVTLAGALDFAIATNHNITVLATSSDGSSNSEVFNIVVGNIVGSPVSSVTDSNDSANAVAENAAAGTTLGLTALATDADVGTTISYSLSSNPGNLFVIGAASGMVTLAGALDYESASSHNITVLATSSDGSTNSAAFSIAVTNVNDNAVSSVTDSNASANALAENASVGAVAGLTALATDADSGTTISYSLSSNPGSLFAIDATTGVVTLASALDFEAAANHNVTVLATSSDGSTNSAVFTIAVTNVNDNVVSTVTDSNATANTLAENASAGAFAGLTAVATDADSGATVTYSLSSNPGNLFAIHGSTGVVTVVGALDYESATSHNITVLATSSDGSTHSAVFSIAVTDVNDNSINSVTDSNAGANTFGEDAAIGTTVGLTALATDADSGASTTYSLSSNPGNLFAINAGTGVVTLAGALDYESATSHDITVLATSSDGSTSSAAFSIAVSNVNDNSLSSVTDSNSGVNTLAENASAGAVTGLTGVATDADSGTSITYSLSSNPGSLFAINASTGVVTLAGALDYESATSHNITVLATSSDGSTQSAAFSIAVTNVNDNSLSSVTDSNASVNTLAENASTGAVTGLTGVATDADSGAGITYSLSSNPGSLFAINASTGVVTLVGALDYESAISHNITVLATSSDGTSESAVFNIAVTNINDSAVSAVTDSNASTNALAENASAGALTGLTALATDADAGATVTYTLSGNPGNLFAIDANTGVLTLVGTLDYESATSHNVTILATSSDGSTQSAVLNIGVINDNDNDVSDVADSNATVNTVAEDRALGTVVGVTASATDADAGATITYSLNRNPGNLFAIDAGTGVVTLVGALDYENSTSHHLTVLATSSDGSTQSAVFTIAVTNVNDNAVSLVADSNATADIASEDSPPGTVVGVTVLVTDADAGATIIYSLGSNPGNLFAIDASTGVVTVAGVLDYETASSHNITVLATSSDGSTQTAVVSIVLTNANDAPMLADSITDQSATLMTPFSFTVASNAFTDADADDALHYAATLSTGAALPNWLQFDGATGTFSGTPTSSDVGALSVRVMAIDRAGLAEYTTFTITTSLPSVAFPVTLLAVAEPVSETPEPPPLQEPVVDVITQESTEVSTEASESSTAELAQGTAPLAATAAEAGVASAPPPGLAGERFSQVVRGKLHDQAELQVPVSRNLSSRSDAVLSNTVVPQFTFLSSTPLGSLLRGDDLSRKFQEIQDQLNQSSHKQQTVMASRVALSGSLTIGYVVWMVRGGVLASSMLSALPAWQMVDPLPVVTAGGRKDRMIGDEGDEPEVERLFDDASADSADPTKASLAAQSTVVSEAGDDARELQL